MSQEAPLVTGSAVRLGKYELVRETTGSGVAASWIARTSDAREPGQGRLWTVVRLHRHVTKNVDLVEVFMREARRAQPLRHKNVLALIETVVGDGEVFAVSEHVEGETLAALERAAGDGGLDEPVVLRIALDALDGLAAAHEQPRRPIVHGELGPASVVVGSDGVARVSGLGLARALARLGGHGDAQGRLSHAAPERVKAMASDDRDDAPIDPRADVFSLGVILWEGLARRRLFEGGTDAAIVEQVLSRPIPRLPLAGSGASLSPLVTEAVERALSRDPSKRFANAREFAAALRAAGPECTASAEDVAAVVAGTGANRPTAPAHSLALPRSVLATMPITHPPPPDASEDSSSQETLRMATPAALLAITAGSLGELRPGTIIDRYELIVPVYQDGVHSVWAARIEGGASPETIVALRMGAPEEDPIQRDAFIDQVRLVARVRHPCLAEILDFGAEDSLLYVVTEWVDGETLETLLAASAGRGGVPLPIALRMVTQVCAGLHAGHELRDSSGAHVRVVHGALSPAAVLVSGGGVVKLAEVGAPTDRKPVVPLLRATPPDPAFRSPEQVASRPVDRRTDVFSAAVLLYVLAAGRGPFTPGKPTGPDIATRAPVPLSELVPGASPGLDRVLLRALQKDPDERFATAGELCAALDALDVPPAQAATDEDVAAFVREHAGATMAARAASIKTALFGLDAGAPNSSRRRSSVRVSSPKITIDASKAFMRPQGDHAMVQETPVPMRETPVGMYGARVADQLTKPEGLRRQDVASALLTPVPPPPRRSALGWVLGAIVLLAVLAAAAVFAMR